MKSKQRFTSKATKGDASPTPSARRQPTHDEVTARAREIWENRGRPQGQDLSIWLEAERKLLSGAIGKGANDDADADTREMLGEPNGSIEDRLESFGESANNRSATSL